MHIKEANYSSCLNYTSICPDSYKVGVINSYLHRAYFVSSNNEILETEMERKKPAVNLQQLSHKPYMAVYQALSERIGQLGAKI